MVPRADDGERWLLVVALGRRLEAAERGLEETEAALRRLGRCVTPEGRVWLVRAQAGLARTRAAVDGLTRRGTSGRTSVQEPPTQRAQSASVHQCPDQ